VQRFSAVSLKELKPWPSDYREPSPGTLEPPRRILVVKEYHSDCEVDEAEQEKGRMTQSLQSIPVFYSEHMLAETGSFSPSAGKPRHVLAAWQGAELPITVRSITPASEMDICLAHDPAYVRGVLEGKVSNSFGNTSLEVARSLPYTSGAMIAASRAALEIGCACAPVSGFHHAQYDSAAGYCTFHGLVITAQKLLAEGAVQRVLILDCDMHYGDGTEEIVERLGLAGLLRGGKSIVGTLAHCDEGRDVIA
jgi:acetoin utilization deacetylase AcuC-like enzyme